MLLWCDLTWASSLEGLEKLLLQYSHLKYLQNISWVFWYKKWFTHNWKSAGFNGLPDLSADAVSPQVIPQWVSVGVGLITDVALGLLALVSRLVNTGSWTVVETSGTPITKIPAKQTESTDQNMLGSFYQSQLHWKRALEWFQEHKELVITGNVQAVMIWWWSNLSIYKQYFDTKKKSF